LNAKECNVDVLLHLEKQSRERKYLHKSQVWLDDDIQPPCTHEAVSTREAEIERGHDMGDANGGRAGYSNPTMDEGGNALLATIFYEFISQQPGMVCSQLDMQWQNETQRRQVRHEESKLSSNMILPSKGI
jgi:hypothetical protein